LLLLETLLHDVAHAELRERGQDVRLGRGAATEQLAALLAHDRAGRYSPHGLGLLSVDLSVTELKLRPLRIYRKARTSPCRYGATSAFALTRTLSIRGQRSL
jgi:hypothetical protein